MAQHILIKKINLQKQHLMIKLLRLLFEELNSNEFLTLLTDVTGISNLITDDELFEVYINQQLVHF